MVSNDLRFDDAFKCVFGMVAGFMEKCVCVCILKINLSEYCIGGSVNGLEENCTVQEVNLL